MNEQELQADVRVDPSQLDVEALEQADLYSKWAQRSAEAEGRVDDLKLDLEILTAKLQNAIRADPGGFNIDKVTDASVGAAVACDPTYEPLARALNRAKAEAGLLGKAERALGMKKNMIEELIRLHGQQYFAGPDVPHNLMEMWEARRKARSSVVTDRQAAQTRRRGAPSSQPAQ